MPSHNFEYWKKKALNLTIEGRAYIDGSYCEAIDGATFECVTPIDGRLLAEIAECNGKDVELAVKNARDTFESGVWSELAPVERKKVLVKFAALIRENAEELALLETLDMGKPISDSLEVDVSGAATCIEWNGEAIDKLYDEIAPTSNNELGLVTREPLGVIAAIVPWNFPLLMTCWKLGPALATGNSVIVKPSEKSPLTAIKIASIAVEAGLPPGVLNVLPGFGQAAGEPLASHMDVDGLVFTGSTGVGKHLMGIAGTTNMKRAFMECGGKSPNIVFPDAPNLDVAAEAAADAIFFNQGEVCTAGSRLLVHEDIKDEFLKKVVEASRKIKPGNPLDPETNMGAIVDQIQMKRVLDFIRKGTEQGGELKLGGEQVMHSSGGFYVEPTIFDGVTMDMSIAAEEIFGPVLSCITFKDEEEAIEIANNTEFGLAAGLWTADITRAHTMAKKLRAGSVWVNYYDGGDMTAPFGGFKQSGNGRDKSIHALEKYTEIKATWINLAP